MLTCRCGERGLVLGAPRGCVGGAEPGAERLSIRTQQAGDVVEAAGDRAVGAFVAYRDAHAADQAWIDRLRDVEFRAERGSETRDDGVELRLAELARAGDLERLRAARGALGG